ncbi:MAG: hypothetical protein ABFD92_02095 [Planctomycetaceae bacterium]|nr:hypothetical protein [Planctomycetaceae bacterium]
MHQEQTISVPLSLFNALYMQARQAPPCGERWAALKLARRLYERHLKADIKAAARYETWRRRGLLMQLRRDFTRDEVFYTIAQAMFPQFSDSRIRLELELAERFAAEGRR